MEDRPVDRWVSARSALAAAGSRMMHGLLPETSDVCRSPPTMGREQGYAPRYGQRTRRSGDALRGELRGSKAWDGSEARLEPRWGRKGGTAPVLARVTVRPAIPLATLRKVETTALEVNGRYVLPHPCLLYVWHTHTRAYQKHDPLKCCLGGYMYSHLQIGKHWERVSTRASLGEVRLPDCEDRANEIHLKTLP